MKIRTNFVTNSSSYSSAEIKIDNPVLLEILQKYKEQGAFLRKDGRDLGHAIGQSQSKAMEVWGGYYEDDEGEKYDDTPVALYFYDEEMADIFFAPKRIEEVANAIFDVIASDYEGELKNKKLYEECKREIRKRASEINSQYVEVSWEASNDSYGEDEPDEDEETSWEFYYDAGLSASTPRTREDYGYDDDNESDDDSCSISTSKQAEANPIDKKFDKTLQKEGFKSNVILPSRDTRSRDYDVKKINATEYNVTSKDKKHTVIERDGYFWCDCGDFQDEPKNCKHIVAVKRFMNDPFVLSKAPNFRIEAIPASGISKDDRYNEYIEQLKSAYKGVKTYTLQRLKDEQPNVPFDGLNKWLRDKYDMSATEYLKSIGVLLPETYYEVVEDKINIDSLSGKKCCVLLDPSGIENFKQVLIQMGAEIVSENSAVIDYVFAYIGGGIVKEPRRDTDGPFAELLRKRDAGEIQFGIVSNSFVRENEELIKRIDEKITDANNIVFSNENDIKADVDNFDDDDEHYDCERWDYIPSNYTVTDDHGHKRLVAYAPSPEEADDLVLPQAIYELQRDVFKGCDFRNVYFDIHIYDIEPGVFSECSRLESINWPNTLYICENMFKNCINLTSVNIPEGVFGIEKGAFAGCKNLENINIPSTVAFIEEGAFDGCDVLASKNPEVWNLICSTNKSKAKFLEMIDSYIHYIQNNGYSTFVDRFYGFQYIIDTMQACKLWHKLYDPYMDNLEKLNAGNYKYVIYATPNQLKNIEANYDAQLAKLGWKKTKDVSSTTDYLIVDTKNISRFTTFIAKQERLSQGDEKGAAKFGTTPLEKAVQFKEAGSNISIIVLDDFCKLLDDTCKEEESVAREEATRKAREEAERNAREETERIAREEAARRAREEAERKAREEAERRAREEAEALRKAKELEQGLALEAAYRKAQEDAERRAKEVAERKAREEAERKAKEEAERKAREEAERKAREEAERKAREEAERKSREEAERKAKEEAERKAREEAELAKKKAEQEKAIVARQRADFIAKETLLIKQAHAEVLSELSDKYEKPSHELADKINDKKLQLATLEQRLAAALFFEFLKKSRLKTAIAEAKNQIARMEKEKTILMVQYQNLVAEEDEKRDRKLSVLPMRAGKKYPMPKE